MERRDIVQDLIGPLLDGAFEDPLWSDFLNRLRLSTGADYTSLIFRLPAPSRKSITHLFSGDTSPLFLQSLYQERLHLSDPLPYHELVEGRPYRLDELLVEDEPRHQAFRAETLAMSGMNNLLVMRVREPSGTDVWLTISRREGEFEEEAGRLMADLAPHLRRALRVVVDLERERFKASVAGDAIQRLNYGWLTLDADCRVLDADATGTHLLDHSGVLGKAVSGRLSARSRTLEKEIVEAVKQLSADPSSRPRALVLNRDPWVDMLLVPAHRRPLVDSHPPAVIAYIHGESWSSADRCEQLAELFDLLPSEARLALALSRGMSIAEAAEDLNLTVDTARTYSKKIYAKTGARGQPDLVRFIHRSILAIA